MSNNRAEQIKRSEMNGWHLYVIHEPGDEYCKIGTAGTPDYRLMELRVGNPRRLVFANVWHVSGREVAFEVEKMALERLGDLRLPGRDWVKCDAAAVSDVVNGVIADLRVTATVIE